MSRKKRKILKCLPVSRAVKKDGEQALAPSNCNLSSFWRDKSEHFLKHSGWTRLLKEIECYGQRHICYGRFNFLERKDKTTLNSI